MPIADLSVVIANRNHAKHLPRALDAVLTQSVLPREVIVLDDYSTDNSLQVIEKYSRRYSGIIRFVRNESHCGVTESYNRLFSIASGRYILPGGADDYILPGFLHKAMELLARNPHAGLCVANGSCTEGESGPLIDNNPGWCEGPRYFSPNEVCRKVWHALPASAVIIRRDALLDAGGYRTELAWYSDWFAFLTVAFRHGVVHIPETLGIRVVRPSSYSANARSSLENVEILGEFLEFMTNAEFADVAPYFRRNGAACHFGSDLIRAAARRADHLDPAILGLLIGFSPNVYDNLANDSNTAVRQIANVFSAGHWRELLSRRADLEVENQRLIEEIQLARLRVIPQGFAHKLRWIGNKIRMRLRKSMGLHPMGSYR